MTRLEKAIQLNNSNGSKGNNESILLGCPGEFGLKLLLDKQTETIIKTNAGIKSYYGCRGISCTECWNQEYKEHQNE